MLATAREQRTPRVPDYTNLLNFYDQDAATEAALTASKVAAEKDTLSRNWGPNYDTNYEIARRGAVPGAHPRVP